MNLNHSFDRTEKLDFVVKNLISIFKVFEQSLFETIIAETCPNNILYTP
jgi:hypothetical protein